MIYSQKSQSRITPPPYQPRNGFFTRASGKLGQALGIATRLAPLALQGYGRYLMKGGLFGVLANMNRPKDAPETPNVSLAKSALLAQLFNAFKKNGPSKGSSLKSALLVAGVQQGLPLLARLVGSFIEGRRRR